jgi:beta-glucanase (GH16 family)
MWDQETMYIGVDDIYYFKYKNEKIGNDSWPFHNKMYLLLNLAVGGNWGGSKGVATDIWPRKMEVDYVRMYEIQK